jgi:hypothetical protein
VAVIKQLEGMESKSKGDIALRQRVPITPLAAFFMAQAHEGIKGRSQAIYPSSFICF